MVQVSMNRKNLSLFLISFTYLAMWINYITTYTLGTVLSFFPLISSDLLDRSVFYLLYLFSYIIPAIGLVFFMKETKDNSPRWYWGIPLLVGMLLITFVRDSILELLFNDNSFMSDFIKWNILEPLPEVGFIILFFSLASALFCLSVQEEKRKKMRFSFILSILAALTFLVFFVYTWINTSVIEKTYPGFESPFFFFYPLHVILIYLLGLSFVNVALDYDKK